MERSKMTEPAGTRLEVLADPSHVGREAARRIVAWLDERPDSLLCAATGSSPTAAYRELVAILRERSALRESLRVLALDEWGGLPAGDPASCDAYLRAHLVEPLAISPERYVSLRSDAPDPALECARVASWVRTHGPVDVCVLGLGRNGHLALNEPGAPPDGSCHVARLAGSSLAHPMLEVASQRPTHGLTLGLAEILASRRIVLLVHGVAKAGPLARLVTGDIDREFPASWLRRHPRLVCLVDEAAASRLTPEEIRDFR